MKLLIASDIHGDIECCKATIEAAKAHNVKKIVLLGDILYHGPRNDLPCDYAPKAVISALNEIGDKLICVRGNCDTEVDQMVLNFPILSTTAMIYDGECDLTMCLSHGHVYNPDNLPPMSEGDVFLYGHTHVLKAENCGGVLCLNPGSVTLPKENNPKTYAIYEGGTFTVYDFEGNEVLKVTR